MKNTIALLLLVFCLGSSVAQESETLKTSKGLHPNRSYHLQITQIVNAALLVEGDQGTIQKLKEAGASLDMVIIDTMTLESAIETGDLKGSNYSVLMTCDTMRERQFINGIENFDNLRDITGSKIYGSLTANGAFEIDSIVGKEKSNARTSAKQTFEKLTIPFPFPDRAMEIGEAFTQVLPLSMPMPGVKPVNLEMTIVYRLKEISNNIAYFDTEESYALGIGANQPNTKVSGNGKGKLEYDLNESMAILYDSISDIELTFDMYSLTVKSKSQNISKQRTVIEKK